MKFLEKNSVKKHQPFEHIQNYTEISSLHCGNRWRTSTIYKFIFKFHPYVPKENLIQIRLYDCRCVVLREIDFLFEKAADEFKQVAVVQTSCLDTKRCYFRSYLVFQKIPPCSRVSPSNPGSTFGHGHCEVLCRKRESDSKQDHEENDDDEAEDTKLQHEGRRRFQTRPRSTVIATTRCPACLGTPRSRSTGHGFEHRQKRLSSGVVVEDSYRVFVVLRGEGGKTINPLTTKFFF